MGSSPVGASMHLWFSDLRFAPGVKLKRDSARENFYALSTAAASLGFSSR